jgi:hypothetical protein
MSVIIITERGDNMIFLKQLPLFAHLAKNELDAIANFLEKHTYGKNEPIFREGDVASNIKGVYGDLELT